MSPVSCAQAGVAELQQRLKHIVWQPMEERTVHVIFTQDSDTDTVRAQLSVLRAVRLSSAQAQRSVRLVLKGLPLTLHTMEALRTGLPEWGGTIDLRACTWPEKAEEYVEMAWCVPLSFSKWKLGSLDSSVFNKVCDGLDARRGGLNLPSLRVSVAVQ